VRRRELPRILSGPRTTTRVASVRPSARSSSLAITSRAASMTSSRLAAADASTAHSAQRTTSSATCSTVSIRAPDVEITVAPLAPGSRM